jgi:predicted ATPase
MWSKGFAAEETSAAYTRVGELASQTGNSVERNAARQAQWIGNFIRGDLNLAREEVEIFLREAEASGRALDTGVARRSVGLTCIFQGEFARARLQLERALADYMPERDIEARRLFGADTGVTAKAFMSLLAWLTGQPDDARRFISQAITEGNKTEHAATIATSHLFLSRLEVTRDDPAAALAAAQALLAFAKAHDIPLYAIYGEIFSSWASGRLTDLEAGVSHLRQAIESYLALGNENAAPSFYALLADLETKTGRTDSALATIETAQAIARANGEYWTDSTLFCRKGELLLVRDPQNTGRAEEALRAAIGVAQQQGARSFGLRAALALAKLYQSTSRRAKAHAALAPPLEGFSPTPEMPEIGEAQALLESLARGCEDAIASKNSPTKG